MGFDVSGPVRVFTSLAVLVVIAGVIAILVGLGASGMPRKRRMALVNLTFAAVMVLGAFIVLL